MSQRLIGAAIALAIATGGAVLAQETTTKTKTTTKGEPGHATTYIGCLQMGSETQNFVLSKVVPLSRTTTVDSSGDTETTTSYALVPEGSVQFQPMIGRRVEVTGMTIPEGDRRTETRTKVERDGAPDSTTTVKSKSKGSLPEFRVTSIRQLAESCN